MAIRIDAARWRKRNIGCSVDQGDLNDNFPFQMWRAGKRRIDCGSISSGAVTYERDGRQFSALAFGFDCAEEIARIVAPHILRSSARGKIIS